MFDVPSFNLWEGVEPVLPGYTAWLPGEEPEGIMNSFGTIDLSAIRSAGSVVRSAAGGFVSRFCSLFVPVALGALFSIFLFKVVKK